MKADKIENCGITAKLLKTVSSAYLYADGHMILCHEEKHAKAGTVRYVTMHESAGVKAAFPVVNRNNPAECEHGSGRLIIYHRSGLAMLLKAEHARPTVASVEYGSENTRNKQIAVSTLALDFGAGEAFITLMPDLISGEFQYQPETGETWAEALAAAERGTWSIDRVAGVYKKKS